MDTFKGSKLTLQIGDTVTSWEVDHQDISINDLLQALHGLCVSQTFISHSFIHGCRDMYEEMRELYDEKSQNAEEEE